MSGISIVETLFHGCWKTCTVTTRGNITHLMGLSVQLEAPRAAEPTPAKAPRKLAERFYKPELDVLRFFAFFIVFLHHVFPLLSPNQFSGRSRAIGLAIITINDVGGFGMCLFFLLSAYLITELLLREKDRTGTIHIPSFYARRILRIWPLYFGFLFVMALVGLILPPFRLETGRLLAFAALAANWYVARYGFGVAAVAPLWSISLEEQFYLIWPFLSKVGGRKGIAVVSAILFPVSWLTIYLLARSGASRDVAIWVNSLVQFQFFGLGALLALVLRGSSLKLSAPERAGAFASGVACWLVADGVFHILRSDLAPQLGRTVAGYVLGAMGCLLVFASVNGSPMLARTKPLVYLGKISYGLYVYHVLCITLSRACVWQILSHLSVRTERSTGSWEYWLYGLTSSLLALGLVILVASLSYRFIEKPFLRLKERFTFVSSRAV